MLNKRLIAVLWLTWVSVPLWAAEPVQYELSIERQSLSRALQEFAKQSGVQIIFFSKVTDGYEAPALNGRYTAAAALGRLLTDSKLTFRELNANTIEIQLRESISRATGAQAVEPAAVGRENALRLAVAETPAEVANESRAAAKAPEDSQDTGGVPEILVAGSRILNMDVKRSRSDPQPYVIIDRAIIEQSGAVSVGDLLKQRLTMNSSTSQAPMTAGNLTGNSSEVNLRGMGSGQTLLLIDGHRLPDFNIGNTVSQASLNGIPLSAIERIEVLPTTAGGIYGGSATGGVVNVILRRDYSGVETKLTYGDTFESHAPTRQVDVSAGFNFEGGKTNVLLSGTYSESDQLRMGDRDLADRGRARILANNPNFYYGATIPPMGSTTNIRSTDGTNLVLDNGTALNSPLTYVPRNYLGRAANDAGAALAANAGRYNFELARTAQNFDDSAGRGMANGPRVKSLMATVRREFSPSINAFLEAGASSNAGSIAANYVTGRFTIPGSAPGNPFQQTINATVPIAQGEVQRLSVTEDMRGVAGVIFKLPAQWGGEVSYTHQRTRMNYSAPPRMLASASTAASSGVLDVTRDTDAYPLDMSAYLNADFRAARSAAALSPWAVSENKMAALRLSGPVNVGLARSPVFSMLLERRDMYLNRTREDSLDFNTSSFYPDRTQVVNSAYAEVQLPLLRTLKLQLAGRYDDYSTSTSGGSVSLPLGSAPPVDTPARNKVSSTDPTVALIYEPVADLKVRASWGTGFLPPPTNRIVTSFGGSSAIIDPLRGNSSYTVSGTTFGGNPDLKPEVTESFSVGMIVMPRFVPGLRLSLDYTSIDKTDGISNSLSGQFVLDNESLLAGRVVRGARLPGDPAGWAGPVTFLDVRPANLSQLRIKAFDLQIDQRIELGKYGNLDLSVLSTWTPHYITQLTSAAPAVELAGITRSNPLKFKGNATATWNYANFTLSWTSYYYGSYLVADPASAASTVTYLNQGAREVSSQVFHDVYAKFNLDRVLGTGRSALVSGTELTLGIRNVFNTRPAFDATGFPYYSVWGDPRMSNYYLSLKTNF